MYAIYKYVAGASRANVLADIAAIFTGETTPGDLSAACDTANTVIYSTVAAGWTDYDVSPPTDTRILRAPYSDDAGNYKYAILYFNTSNQLRLRAAESWDTGTNTATNETGNTLVQRAISASGGTFLLAASERFLAAIHDLGTGSTRGDTTSYGLGGVFERTRLQPWDTVGAAYPKALQLETGILFSNSVSSFRSPRLKLPAGTDSLIPALNAGTIGCSYTLWGTSAHYPTGVDKVVKDSGGTDRAPLYPLYAVLPATFAMPIGEISSICDVWVPPLNFYAHLDEFTKDGNTYVCLQGANTNSAVLAFRKG